MSNYSKKYKCSVCGVQYDEKLNKCSVCGVIDNIIQNEQWTPSTEESNDELNSNISQENNSSSVPQTQISGIDSEGNIIDLNALYNALLNDKRSITIKDPALNEYKVLMAKDTKALKNMLSGGGKGFALGLAGAGLSFIPVIGPVLALGMTVAGLFRSTKALTYDLAMGIKSDNELKAVQQEIRKKIPTCTVLLKGVK